MVGPYAMGSFGRTILLGLILSSTTTLGWAAPRKPSEHVVQSGQTLAKIAKRYNLTIEELCEANDLKRSTTLKLGQRLSLPTDDEDEPQSHSRGRIADERSIATVGRGSGTSQKLGQLRNASFSRYLARPVKKGYVHLLGFHGEYKGQLVGKSGKLQEKSVIALSRVMAWPRTDFIMDRRLLLMLAKVSDAFGGRTIRFVSGYRTTSYASESKHPLGRACDFSILGVPNAALRDYVRTFNDVGVGYYPNSTFVHMDVREYEAYWVDYAGPGEAPRYRNAVAKKNTRDNEANPSNSDSDANERTAKNAVHDAGDARNNVVTEAMADSAKDAQQEPPHSVTTAKADAEPPVRTDSAPEKPSAEPSESATAESL